MKKMNSDKKRKLAGGLAGLLVVIMLLSSVMPLFISTSGASPTQVEITQ